MRWELEGRPVLPHEGELVNVRRMNLCSLHWHTAGDADHCKCGKLRIESRGHVDMVFVHSSGVMLTYGVIGDEFCIQAVRK